MAGVRSGGLWCHADFLRFWTGQTFSLFGSEVSLLAVPLVAAITLDASPAEMGMLVAAPRAPYILFGLFAGVWVDRLRRRPILMTADIGRAVLMGSIPVAALLGALSIELLFVVTLLAGVLTVFHDVAYQSFLPTLVEKDGLVEGNSKLETSRSAAQIAGPGVAGWLVQLVMPPMAIAVNAATFLVSAACLGLIRTAEAIPAVPNIRRGVKAEIGEGLRFVLRNPYLRAIAGSNATGNLFDAVQIAVFVLYVTRDLDIQPAVLGLILACGNIGLLLGALVVGGVTERIGIGRTILTAAVMMAVARVLVPLAAGPLDAAISLLVVAQFITALGRMLYNVSHLSLRQSITPDAVLGRVNATMRFIAWGVVPIGALIGGLLGEAIGLRETLAVGALGGLTSILWVSFSPVASLRSRSADFGDAPGLQPDSVS